MTNFDLATDYLNRARLRVEMLDILLAKQGFPDVVRGCQEVVELILKAVLRRCHVDPPHWHDVSQILVENRDKLPPGLKRELDRACDLSARLRKERELAFYGDDDFIPSRQYDRAHAERFLDEARWLLTLIEEDFR